MAKNNKILYIGAAIAALFVLPKLFAAPTTPTGGGGTGTPTGGGGTPTGGGGTGTPKTYSYPIKWMQYHPDIKELQNILPNVKVDGIIGAETSAALANFGIIFKQLSIIPNRAMLDFYIDTILNYNNSNAGGDCFKAGVKVPCYNVDAPTRERLGCLC